MLFRVQSYSKKLKANKKFTFFSLRFSAVKQVVFQRLTKLGEKAWEGVFLKALPNKVTSLINSCLKSTVVTIK